MSGNILREEYIDGETIEITLLDGRIVRIVMDTAFDEVSVIYNESNVGTFAFRNISEGIPEATNFYLVQNIDITDDSLRRKGIGTSVLEFFKEYNNAKLVASPNDGIRKEDGSHLVNDGALFVSKMRECGIVEKDFSQGFDSDEYE